MTEQHKHRHQCSVDGCRRRASFCDSGHPGPESRWICRSHWLKFARGAALPEDSDDDLPAENWRDDKLRDWWRSNGVVRADFETKADYGRAVLAIGVQAQKKILSGGTLRSAARKSS